MAYTYHARIALQRMAPTKVLRPKNAIVMSQFLPVYCHSCNQQRQVQFYRKEISETMYKTRVQSQRFTSNTTDMSSEEEQRTSFWSKTFAKLQSISRNVFRKSILAVSAKNIYESCADQVDYKMFFKICSLPDTFQSWFQVFHLHFWMCYIRLKAEDKEGQFVQRQMTECMWEDIKERMKILGVEDPSMIKKSFNQLAEQFYGVTIAYNKGYIAEDEKDFEKAVWRNLFDNNENFDRRNLDVVIRYIVEQMNSLDDMDSEELLTKGRIEWLPIQDFVGKN